MGQAIQRDCNKRIHSLSHFAWIFHPRTEWLLLFSPSLWLSLTHSKARELIQDMSRGLGLEGHLLSYNLVSFVLNVNFFMASVTGLHL